MDKTIKIRVRDYGQTYTASGGGKRASCTASRSAAIHRLAEKIVDGQDYEIKQITSENYNLVIKEACHARS